jgi:hypothetical protein
MHLMKQFCRENGLDAVTWIFTAAGHGKGAPDGVGASVKRAADRMVSTGHNVMRAADLSEIAGDNILSWRV